MNKIDADRGKLLTDNFNGAIVWRSVRRSIIVSPWLLILLLCWFLYDLGQLREIYIYTAQSENVNKLIFGFLGMLLLVAILFQYIRACSAPESSTCSGNARDSQSSNQQRDRVLRDGLAIGCSVLPLITIGITFWLTGLDLEAKMSIYDAAARSALLDDLAMPREFLGLPSRMAVTSLVWLFLVVAIIATLWFGRIYIATHEELRSRLLGAERFCMRLVLAATVVTMSLASIANWLFPDSYLRITQLLGPLCVLALALFALANVLFWIGNASRKIGVPFLSSLFLFLVLLAPGRNMELDSSSLPGRSLRDLNR